MPPYPPGLGKGGHFRFDRHRGFKKYFPHGKAEYAIWACARQGLRAAKNTTIWQRPLASMTPYPRFFVHQT